MAGIKRSLWLFLGYVLLAAAGKAPAATLQTIQPPQNFQGEAISETEIRWSWNPVLGSSTQLGATRYELRDENQNTIASIPSDTTSYIETGLTPGTEYCRYVAAIAGSESASSSTICVSTPAPPPVLLPPTGFSGQVISKASILWSWNAASGAENYRLEDLTGRVLAIVRDDGSGAFSYLETGLFPNRLYTRFLRSTAGPALSGPTEALSFTTAPGRQEKACGITVTIDKKNTTITSAAGKIPIKVAGTLENKNINDCKPMKLTVEAIVGKHFKTTNGVIVTVQNSLTLGTEVYQTSPVNFSFEGTENFATVDDVLNRQIEDLKATSGGAVIPNDSTYFVRVQAVAEDKCGCVDTKALGASLTKDSVGPPSSCDLALDTKGIEVSLADDNTLTIKGEVQIHASDMVKLGELQFANAYRGSVGVTLKATFRDKDGNPLTIPTTGKAVGVVDIPVPNRAPFQGTKKKLPVIPVQSDLNINAAEVLASIETVNSLGEGRLNGATIDRASILVSVNGEVRDLQPCVASDSQPLKVLLPKKDK